jgi:hypothetical protein
MSAASLPSVAVEAPAFVMLQREMHNALLRQHPEWIETDGNCPKCDEYDRRFAKLLRFFETLERSKRTTGRPCYGSETWAISNDGCQFARF